MDNQKKEGVLITPRGKEPIECRIETSVGQRSQNGQEKIISSEMELLKEVDQKLDLLLTSLDITSTKEF